MLEVQQKRCIEHSVSSRESRKMAGSGWMLVISDACLAGMECIQKDALCVIA